ncbi:ATP-binding cassette transporter [Rhizoctonia solani AG-1 IA]|uniref:ATP-binding cassette transporter n=1 Tax=Thanatephorus cucumeris (strain AG1-IA) TaxID=983506 RepID=L8WIH9_THACA|nr:ATP-binding cassette transporter [Rhizoctonia solani AG-1 IA]
MGFMVLSFPIPGKLAYLFNDIQVARMKKDRSDERDSDDQAVRLGEEGYWAGGRETRGRTEVLQKATVPGVDEHEHQVGRSMNERLQLLTVRDAATVFSSIGVFDVLRNQLHMLFWHIPMTIQAKVSLDRIDDFVQNTELLDSFNDKEGPVILDPNPPASDAIGFRNATFTWTRQVPGTPTPSRRNFRLHIDEEVLFRRGKINMVAGPTGCGKTSLLMALEMHFVPSSPDSWFSLPRDGGVAYAAQEAWVQNETIRVGVSHSERS